MGYLKLFSALLEVPHKLVNEFYSNNEPLVHDPVIFFSVRMPISDFAVSHDS